MRLTNLNSIRMFLFVKTEEKMKIITLSKITGNFGSNKQYGLIV